MKIYTATTKAAAAAQALFNFIMSANPIALVIIAVAAFVAALIVLEKRFGIISKGFELFSDGFYKFIINPIKQAIGFISDLIGAFKRIPGVGAIGGFLGGINIPGFADGGIVTRPTLAMVGEKGPEAIVPLGRGGGVGGVTVNVTGGLSTSAEIGQAVVNAIRAYNRSAGPAQIQVA
jgi:SLT domain-containing protein